MKEKSEPTVHVVDDDEAVRNALERLLSSVKLPARLYASGDQFLDEYRDDNPGCLVTDVRMPGMSGMDIQREIKARNIDLPIIMITGYGDLEISYAEKLDNIALKTNKIFSEIIDDLFSDDELLPRLRRLFWLEATKSERDFNNYLVKPIIKQHDRKLSDPELRKAMEIDLENVSDVEELMNVWQGLHNLETLLTV